MMTLFTKDYDKLINFIFNFYDIDKVTLVSKENIKSIILVAPLSDSSIQLIIKIGIQKIKSLEEIILILDKTLEDLLVMDKTQFTFIVENSCSELFLIVIIIFNQSLCCFY